MSDEAALPVPDAPEKESARVAALQTLGVAPPAGLDPEASARETINPRRSMIADPSAVAVVIDSAMETDARSGQSFGVRWTVSERRAATDSDRAALAKAPVYRLERVVGRGGMGEVWEATQESLGRKVAIKRIRPEGAPGGGGAEKSRLVSRTFQHEALITACLDHPNIVPVYDLGEDAEGQPLIAMKLVRGIPWDELVQADRHVDYLERLSKHLLILMDVAQAVAFAHSRGVIHRDIKPSQVMVGEFGEVMLLDWGVACYYTTGDQGETEALFREGEFAPAPLMRAMNPAGTPAYMAPEQTEPGAERLGPWTDIFLLGATLYQLLTDQVPYPARTAHEAMAMAALHRLTPPESRPTDGRRVPPELARICARAMAKNPWERHASVTEFIEELRGFMTGFGKRRQSVELTNDVLARLGAPEASAGYAPLQECHRLLVLARQLWEENPQLDELDAMVAERIARAALACEDLGLAAAEADRLPDERAREALLREVERRRRVRDRIRRQRRSFAIATALLVVIAASCLLVALDTARRAEAAAGAAPGVAAPQNGSVE